jgi:tRNA 2-selenouridine synthase
MEIEYVSCFDFTEDQIVIDVRSPAEFSEDHIPGAINLPVLDNTEFSQVGTLYKEKSPFEASKVGSSMVAKNISSHLNGFFFDKTSSSELVFYCARGGKRSQSFAHVCKMIGWRSRVIQGGYKAYRRHVLTTIREFCQNAKLVILGGKTGIGKTDILKLLASKGHNVIDLEGLANHRGSILGSSQNRTQPKQKQFESALYREISKITGSLAVFVESESSKIGNLIIPTDFWRLMKKSPTIIINNTLANRVKYIIDTYDPNFLIQKEIPSLFVRIKRNSPGIDLHSLEEDIQNKAWDRLVLKLLNDYYDPLYSHSIKRRENNVIAEIDSLSPVASSVSEVSKKIESILAQIGSGGGT